MIAIYSAVFNIFFDTNISQIIIIINSTNKAFIFNKNIYLGSIYKYIDILYITMFSSRYLRVSLTLTSFQNDILAINVEFTFIPEVEVILIIEHVIDLNFNLCPDLESTFYTDNFLKLTFSTSVNNVIYTIIANII